LDNHYEIRWKVLPEIINDWIIPYFPLNGKRILDFGCGDGATALGFAMNYNPSEVLGIEVQSEELENCIPRARSNLKIKELPLNFKFNQIRPGEDLDRLGEFDLIYAWSVFEHVDQGIVSEVLLSIKNALNTNGLFFIQIAPLYFSAFGSHLGEFIKEPWAHLGLQHNRLLNELRVKCQDTSKYNELIYCYETLNKITSNELKHFMVESGFEIVREYRTYVDGFNPDESLLGIYDRDVLMTEQIVLLAKLKK